MAKFFLNEFNSEQGRLILQTPSFDFDSFSVLANQLLQLLNASLVEKQQDADLHSWLIDFEGCQLMLRGEHYSESVWLESLSANESDEVLAYLARLLQKGI
jgi:hypothetical protein